MSRPSANTVSLAERCAEPNNSSILLGMMPVDGPPKGMGTKSRCLPRYSWKCTVAGGRCQDSSCFSGIIPIPAVPPCLGHWGHPAGRSTDR